MTGDAGASRLDALTSWHSDWKGLRVVVLGLSMTGFSVADTLADMYRAGHRRILVFPTSAWGGYSGCRQYHEDIGGALDELGRRCPRSVADDPVVLRKLPQYWSEPAFLDAGADAVRAAVAELPAGPADSPR
mgnify:CR=1 FL=1